MKNSRIPSHEFKQILDWAENVRSNEEFWQRVLIAGTAYSPIVQIKLAKLVAFVMTESNDEPLSNYP